MFDSLSTRLQDVFKTLRGEATLTPESIEAALREIRLALLEADVNFKVVKAFVDRVRDRAMGQDVLRSLSPSQQVVKIVRDEMLAERFFIFVHARPRHAMTVIVRRHFPFLFHLRSVFTLFWRGRHDFAEKLTLGLVPIRIGKFVGVALVDQRNLARPLLNLFG